MRIFSVALIGAGIALTIQTSWAQGPEFDKGYAEVIKEAQNSRLVAEVLNMRFQRMKHWLDRDLDTLYKSDPVGQSLRAAVTQLLMDETLATRIQHKSHMAQARRNPDQYRHLLEVTEEIARKLGFSEATIRNMFLGVANGPVNAYTYSGLPDHFIDLVLFKDLISVLSEDELRGVIGHELGHIKSQHILNQTISIVIFLATGENIIDDVATEIDRKKRKKEKDAAQEEAKEEEESTRLPSDIQAWKQEMRQQLLEALNQQYKEMSKTLFSNPFIPAGLRHDSTGAASSTLLSMPKLLQLSNKLRTSLTREQLNGLAGKVGISLSSNHSENHQEELENAAAGKKNIRITYEKLMEFIASLTQLSNSCESSSDRFGALVTSLDASSRAFLKLAGGESVEAMEAQSRELAEMLKDRQDFRDAAFGESHPAILHRIGAVKDLENDPIHRVLGNTFMDALDALFWTGAMQDRNHAIRKDDRAFVRELENDRHQSSQLKETSDKLSLVIRKEILRQLLLKDPEIDSLVMLHAYLLHQIGNSNAPPEAWSTKGGILFDLKVTLAAIVESGKTPEGKPLNPKQVKAVEYAMNQVLVHYEVHDLGTGIQTELAVLGLPDACGLIFKGGIGLPGVR